MNVAAWVPVVLISAPALLQAEDWRPLWNGKDLSGWETYLAPPPGKSEPIGLGRDPLGVFSIVEVDGAPAIRISGEVYGALSTLAEFENFHLRLEYRWGEKRWPPREHVGRDSGILYNCVGPHGAGSGAWMRSIECNIMEKGTGQWWSVAGAVADVEGERMTAANEARVPYKMESPGENIIVYRKGGERFTARPWDGITPAVDPEKPRGEWNTVEVVCLGSTGVHVVNGVVNLVVTNARHVESGRATPLTRGKIQLQSEAAEVFYRKIEIRPIREIPAAYRAEGTPTPYDDEGFALLLDPALATGWAQCGPGGFDVRDGIASARGGMGLWWYRARPYGNFILRGEFVQDQPLADSGVFVRFPDPGDDPWVAVHQGHEIEIGDDKVSKGGTGSIYDFQAPTALPLRPPGEWNEYEIACAGEEYTVRLNRKLINRYRSTRRSEGHIGLQNYDDGKSVRHRNLRIRELPPDASAYHVLFEGDWTGWKMCGPGSFELDGDTLLGRGGMGLFWHERRLRDFILELDWKAARPDDNSGVFVRFPDPGDDPWSAVGSGYEIQIHEPTAGAKDGTGAVYSFQAAVAAPAKPHGDWNHMAVEARGQDYTVRINGRRVNEYRGDRALEGQIGLQNHGDPARTAFREVRVIELAPASVRGRARADARRPASFPHRIWAACDFEARLPDYAWFGTPVTEGIPEYPGNRTALRAGPDTGSGGAIVAGMNPVPGPRMGKENRLWLRYRIEGAREAVFQHFSLSSEDNNHIRASGLDEGRWSEIALDFTRDALRNDGTPGVPFREGERMDDFKTFVGQPGTKGEGLALLIDDVIFYSMDPDLSPEPEPFPNRVIFLAAFDTGTGPRERDQFWPGTHEIVTEGLPPGSFWGAARAVPRKDGKGKLVQLRLDPHRRVGERTKLRFRYHLSGSSTIIAQIFDVTDQDNRHVVLGDLEQKAWRVAFVDFTKDGRKNDGRQTPFAAGHEVDDLFFFVEGEGGAEPELLVDEVVLFDAGR